MNFYVSCRPLKIKRELIFPGEHLSHNFVGMGILFTLTAYNHLNDGRILYLVSIPTEDSDVKSAVLEGLQLFSAHEKSLDSAKSLAEKICGVPFVIDGGLIRAENERVRA